MPEYTIISTGLTNGFGELIPKILQKQDLFHVLLARTPQNVNVGGLNKSKVKVIKCDLASISSVMEAIQQIQALADAKKIPPVKYFLGNGSIQYPDRIHKTGDGYECTFQTNVMSYYILLTKCVLKLMEGVPSPRVFLTGSGVHYGNLPGMPPTVWPQDLDKIMLPIKDDSGDDPASAKAGRRAYVTSKLCIIYLAHKLADLHPKIDFLVYNPGMVTGTQLARNYPAPMRAFVAVLTYIPFFYLRSDVSTRNTAAKKIVKTIFADKLVPTGNVGYSNMGTPEKSADSSYDVKKRESLWEALEKISV